MVKVISTKTSQNTDGKPFVSLKLQGGVEVVQSQQTGKAYLTARTCYISTTFDEATAESLIGSRLPGNVQRDYVLQEKNGKMVPEKVGMKGVTRDGMDYEFTLVFELDIKHNAVASKDRTGLFEGKPEGRISIAMGKQILEWCNLGSDVLVPLIEVQDTAIQQSINNCKTVEQLLTLYKMQTPSSLIKHTAAFTMRRKQLLEEASVRSNPISHNLKASSNGQHNNPGTGTE